MLEFGVGVRGTHPDLDFGLWKDLIFFLWEEGVGVLV